MSTVFLSYRRDDSAGYAGRLHESLERRLGADRVFRDVDALEPGQDFVRAIDGWLRECRVFIALIGREWLDARDREGTRRLDQDADYVRIEIAAALSRPDVRLIPVFVEGAGMPRTDQLPESIRGLTRLQGLSLRDETWDADVGRLVDAIRRATGEAGPRSTVSPDIRPGDRASAPRRPGIPAAAAIVGLAAVAAIVFVMRGRPAPAPGASPGSSVAVPAAQPGAAPPAVTARGSAPAAAVDAHPIALPRIVETVHGSLIYTVLAGSVSTAPDAIKLRLRIRASNDDRFATTFWDDAFRLQVAGSKLTPTSGLIESTDAHSLKQAVISFDVPASVRTADLIIEQYKQAGTIPLDFTPVAGSAKTEEQDTSDALSRALVTALLREPKVLISTADQEYVVRSASARRFANALRLTVGVRLTNRSRSSVLFSGDAFRIAADGELLAPVDGPAVSVPPDATQSGDFVFDLPPDATRAVFRVRLPDATGEMTFEISR